MNTSRALNTSQGVWHNCTGWSWGCYFKFYGNYRGEAYYVSGLFI